MYLLHTQINYHFVLELVRCQKLSFSLTLLFLCRCQKLRNYIMFPEHKDSLQSFFREMQSLSLSTRTFGMEALFTTTYINGNKYNYTTIHPRGPKKGHLCLDTNFTPFFVLVQTPNSSLFSPASVQAQHISQQC